MQVIFISNVRSFCILAKKLREEGVPDSEIQVRGSLEYRQMSPNSKEEYANAAAVINAALPEPASIPKDNMIRRIVKNIETNVSIIIMYFRPPLLILDNFLLKSEAHPVDCRIRLSFCMY